MQEPKKLSRACARCLAPSAASFRRPRAWAPYQCSALCVACAFTSTLRFPDPQQCIYGALWHMHCHALPDPAFGLALHSVFAARRMVEEAREESAQTGCSVAEALSLEASLGGAEVALQVDAQGQRGPCTTASVCVLLRHPPCAQSTCVLMQQSANVSLLSSQHRPWRAPSSQQMRQPWNQPSGSMTWMGVAP